MRVKIFSVRADENFKAIQIGEDTRRLSAHVYLEREIQQFLDQHPNIYIRHEPFSTMVIIPKMAAWHPTNKDIEGMQDDGLWEMAQREERLLITTDKGFPQYRAVPHHRVFIIRLRRPNRHKIHHRIMQALRQFSDTEWSDLLVVMRDVAQSTWRVRESH